MRSTSRVLAKDRPDFAFLRVYKPSVFAMMFFWISDVPP
jgi:hypothetical protein